MSVQPGRDVALATKPDGVDEVGFRDPVWRGGERLPGFAGLSDADLAAIGHATTLTHCVRGQQILSPDDPPDRIHIVRKGRVRVYRMTSEGKQLTLDIVEKGTILGDMGLLGQDPLPEAYAEAIDDAVICTITPDELRELIVRFPVIGVNIIHHLSRRLQAAERELEAMAYQRVDQRLARKLLDLAQRFGVTTERGTLLQARLTQQELAAMVGTTRETLAHTLADFRRRDLLDTSDHQVVIRDEERLAEVGGYNVGAWSGRASVPARINQTMDVSGTIRRLRAPRPSGDDPSRAT